MLLRQGGLIVATETDLTDREYYLLKPSVARAFDKVRVPTFQYLHWLSNRKHPSVDPPSHLRTESSIRKLLESPSSDATAATTAPTVLGTYYFDECPLNTIGLLIL
jgi:hypothetical protein